MDGGGAKSIVSLGETQLQIQMTASTGVDTIAVGVLGVDAALAAVIIAVNTELFGHLYWLPLAALAFSALSALVALVGGGLLGLTPQAVYERCANMTEEQVDRHVITILDASVKSLRRTLARKNGALVLALVVLTATVVVTVLTDVKL